jgi:hypothetical protein
MADSNTLANAVRPRRIADLKSAILEPALTSHFAVRITPPPNVISFLSAEGRIANLTDKLDTLCLLCSDATLPGSSLFTHEVTSDYPGVTEKMVYRRQYDDYSSFQFYVDAKYDIIEMFDGWINYIVGEGDGDRFPRDAYKNPNASYRMKFRDGAKGYTGQLSIIKFERNIGSALNRQNNTIDTNSLQGPKLIYEFVKAFPISIDSMPVSYEGGTILKCNVNFNYLRYVRERLTK